MNHTNLQQYYIQSSMGYRHLYSVPTDRDFDIPSSKRFKTGLTKVEIFYLSSCLLLRTMKKVIVFVVQCSKSRGRHNTVSLLILRKQ